MLETIHGLFEGEQQAHWPSNVGIVDQARSLELRPRSDMTNKPGNTPWAKYLDGRYPGQYALTSGATYSDEAGIEVRRQNLVNDETIVVGFARWENPSASNGLCARFVINGNPLMELRINAARRLEVTFPSSTTVYTSAELDTVPLGTWVYLEIKYRGANTGGLCEVRLNGKTVISFSGDTWGRSGTTYPSGRAIEEVHFLTAYNGTTPSIAVGDIYVLNTQGVENNDFLGEIRVDRVYPTADGSSSDFLGSDGDNLSNFALVSSLIPSESEYVSSSVVGATDMYIMSDLQPGAGDIVSVTPRIYASKQDEGQASITYVVDDGTTSLEGPSVPLGTGIAPIDFASLPNPPGGGSWTPEKVNNTQFGVRVTDG